MDWNHLLIKIAQNKLDVVIVSAFYGLIRYDTHISDYDLDMSKAGRLWLFNNTIGNALKKYIVEKEFSKFCKSSIQYFISLFRPVIFKKRLNSNRPRSPVRNQPSAVNRSADSSGKCKYPDVTLGPRTSTSPLPSSSRRSPSQSAALSPCADGAEGRSPYP